MYVFHYVPDCFQWASGRPQDQVQIGLFEGDIASRHGLHLTLTSDPLGEEMSHRDR